MAKPEKSRRDLYREVADKIIAQLEGGVRPWMKPWSTKSDSLNVAIPRRHNGERYRGVNVFLLWGAAEDKGYSSPFWMTYKQAGEYKGQVRKGETSTKVYYSDRLVKSLADDKRKAGLKPEPGDEKIKRQIWLLKEYSVFNADQIDGLPERFHAKPAAAPTAEFEPIEHAAQLLGRQGATVVHGGTRACYVPDLDLIRMPPAVSFHDNVSYYGTLAHELVHWTGHSSRLAREFGKRFGDKAYAVEELVAEMGSAFLAAELGLWIEPREDHASYLKSWLDVLKAKPVALFTAASKASDAADLILDRVAQPEQLAA